MLINFAEKLQTNCSWFIFQKQHNVVIWNARLVNLSYTLITFLAIYVSYMYMYDLVSYAICSLHWTWVWDELKSSLRQLYGGHHNMINSYGIYVLEMTRICPNCRNHNLALSSLMSYHRVCYNSNTTTATSGAWSCLPLQRICVHTDFE